MEVTVGEVVRLTALVEQAAREGCKVHLFGGSGFWLVEWITGSTTISGDGATLGEAVEKTQQRAGLD